MRVHAANNGLPSPPGPGGGAELIPALRCFPPIATNSRMAHRDTVVPCGGGPDGRSPLLVRRHDVVTYSTFVMHRRREFFGEDADEFRPERWGGGEGEAGAGAGAGAGAVGEGEGEGGGTAGGGRGGGGGGGLRPGWEYLPFNGGPRICPGQKFALTEASYTVARLLRAFSAVESRDPSPDWREQLTLSLTLNNGVHCRLTPA